MKTVHHPAAAAAKAASGSVPTAAANAATEGVIRQLREHGQKTAAELQRKYQSAESRATMAEEQLAQLQAYMAKASVSYQKEIVRLRAIVGQMEVSMGVKQGSYLNLNPLEGAGGGGALRPAAEVLDEHEQRGSAGSRQGQRGGGQGQGGGRQR